MELLIGLVVLGLMAFGFFGLVFLGWSFRKDGRAIEREPEILDNLFSGDRHVTYRSGVVGALPFEKVVVGGIERGYTLTHDSTSGGAQVLIFELTDPSLTPDRPLDREADRDVRSAGAGSPYWPLPFFVGAGLAVAGVLLMIGLPDGVGPGLAMLMVGSVLAYYGNRLRNEAVR